MSELRRGVALRAWVAVLLWAALVLRLSGEDLSAASTVRLLAPLLRWLLPDAGPGSLELLHSLVRKAAHVVEYAVLGGLALVAFGRTPGIGPLLGTLLAACLVVGVAGVDEAVQAVSPARTGSLRDVGLDVAGGALAIALVWLRRWRHGRRPPRPLPQAPRPGNLVP